MTVRHHVGTLDIEGADIVSNMSGTRGFLKKEKWEQVERIPIPAIVSVNITQEANGSLSLTLTSKPTKSVGAELPRGFTSCQPVEEVESFLTTIVGENPSITVNNVDMKSEIARLRQAKEEADNEVIGIDRRVTLTRLALGGVVGGLLFKKREIVRRKDL